MKKYPKGSIIFIAGKDNKPVRSFQVLSTEIDYSSAWRIHAADQWSDEDDSHDDLNGVSDSDDSNECSAITFVIDNMNTDDDTSDIDDGNIDDGEPLTSLMSSLDDDFDDVDMQGTQHICSSEVNTFYQWFWSSIRLHYVWKCQTFHPLSRSPFSTIS